VAGAGVGRARQDLLVGAAGVRDELARAETALARGRPDEAEAAVQAAQRSLAVAATVPERRELRVAARLPVLSGGIADTRRLLAAAGGLTGAGERAVAVVPHLRAGPAALLRGDRFDLDALDDAAAQAKGMVAELEAARAQLQEVKGGPLEPGVDETRRWALGQLDGALGRARPLAATLDALPAALGVGEPRRYLVVLARPAGGTPWPPGRSSWTRASSTWARPTTCSPWPCATPAPRPASPPPARPCCGPPGPGDGPAPTP